MRIEEIKKTATEDRKEAYEELYRQYFDRIFYYCMHITGCREESLEIAQEVFIKAYMQENLFDGEFSTVSWIYRVAGNECRKSFRLIKKLTHLFEWGKKEIEDSFLPEEITDYEKVNRKLESMPEKYRSILFLRYFEKMSYEDIAESLGVKKGTVMSRLSRAKDMFRRYYEKI